MVLEPRIATVAIRVQPGQLLGLTLCQVSNNVNEIVPGLVDELNRARPGSVEVGDRILEVNGEEGAAFLLIRQWVGRLNGPGTLRLTILRPVEFDVAIDISAGKELGLDVMDIGFVKDVASHGMIAGYNDTQSFIGGQCLRQGDRIVQVSGRSPSCEDGAPGNVLPYLRLAVCGGASPLCLRVRRGEHVPDLVGNNQKIEAEVMAKSAERPAEKAAKMIGLPTILPKASATGQKPSAYSCLQSVLTPAALRSVQALKRFGRPAPKAERCKVGIKVEEPATPSTRGPSSGGSHISELDFDEFAAPGLTIPGIVRRCAA